MNAQYLQVLLATLVGATAHQTFFIAGELDTQAATIARIHMFAAACIFVTKKTLQSLLLRPALWETALISATYCVGLFSSILIYRLFFSPLKDLPGPVHLRFTKFCHVYRMSREPNFKFLHGCREAYGDVVRTGPNEVTMFGLDAYRKVHGAGSTCGRAAYYDMLLPMVSLDTTRSPAVHTHRRKLWDQAFSMKAMANAEEIVYVEARKLVEQLQAREGGPVNVTKWLGFYTFDLMGKFGLTIDFENLSRGEPHPILSLFWLAHCKLGPLACVPWLKHLLMGIPYVERMKHYRQFMRWADSELEKNIKIHDTARRNIIGYVIQDAINNGGLEKNWHFVVGDFVLVIAAGSDPMRQVLTNLMYYLTKSPKHLSRLREELGSIDITDYRALQKLPLLTAIIYETVRLNPAVPSAGLRLAPKGGITINGVYLPEYTTIVTPQYSLHRDPEYFVKPDEWIPERFTTRGDLVLNGDAFVPWSIGKYGCIGKNLSLMEIRVATALILTTFSIAFAPGEDGEKMFTEATDFFTTSPGPLHLVMQHLRGRKSEH